MKKLIVWLKEMRVVLLSIAAVLVAVPAIINAGVDIYNSVEKIPKGSKEKQNSELFQKHFKESPIFTAPLEVKGAGETRQISIDVYENGDIFVVYGQSGQWFPFKAETIALERLLTGVAYAQTVAPAQTHQYIQKTDIKDGYVTQERVYTNNVKEVLTIDKNSGKVVSTKTTTAQPSEKPRQGQKSVVKANTFVIDIDSIKKAQSK